MKKIYFCIAFLLLYFLSYCQQDLVEESTIGMTKYDVQTTRSMQDRIFHYPDGTIGATYNFAQSPNGLDDLGVGYSYYDGNAWGPMPTSGITSGIAKNPSYTAYGENGEIMASEAEEGLYINYRLEKGTGIWQEIIFSGPAGCEKLYSPQMVTSGVDDHIINLFALCMDTSLLYLGQENIFNVLFSRTTDGGISWAPVNYEFNLNSGSFGFSELSIIAAVPKDDVLAFVVGDYFANLLLVKSMDGGNTWQETVIWEHPYPYMQFGVTVTDTFWANNGSMDIALDEDFRAHVVFSLCHIASESSGWYNDPWADGIVYWNEDMDPFSGYINSLNPQGHPDSELIEDYNLIGWSQDINGNGELDFLPFSWDNPPFYPSLGLSTMPSITIKDNGEIIVVWSSLTETYNNGTNDYRHLWARMSPNLGAWWSNFGDLTNDLIHIFDECVFPNSASYADDFLHLVYQFDNEPGLYYGGYPPDNFINHMKVELYGYPNPYVIADFSADTTTIHEGDTINFTNLSVVCPPGVPDSYWEFEGGLPTTSNLLDPSVVYNTHGVYDVTLTATSYTLTDTEIKENYITVLPQIGITDAENDNEVFVFPNPSSGKLFFHIAEANLQVKIFNLMGEVVLKKSLTKIKEQYELDLSYNKEGIYFIEIKSNGIKYIEKIILK